jgi:hypothetical protein
LLGYAKDRGVEDPWQTLQAAAAERPTIQVFLDRAQSTMQTHTAAKKVRTDPAGRRYAEIKPRLDSHLGFGLAQWGKTASEEDLRVAAEDLALETDPRRLRRYLHMFRRRPFPLEPNSLIKLVAHPDQLISIPAVHALMNTHHPDVRALALKLLETPNRLAAHAIGLLVQNFAPGDHARVEALAFAPLDDEALHSPNPDSEERVLRYLYENDPCSLCRGRVVLRLARLMRLPAWMAEEVRYDADAGIYAELEKCRLVLANPQEPT